MPPIISRAEALGFLEQFRCNWETGEWKNAKAFLSSSVKLRSSHKGELEGEDSIVAAFRDDKKSGQHLNLVTSNFYVADNGEGMAMVSAYLYGEIAPAEKVNPAALFGAVVRLTMKLFGSEWKISELLVNISWIEGDSNLLSEWALPSGQRGWRPGDAPPALVSELDSPWSCIPDNKIVSTPEEQIEESYSRYSWGIDQNDFGQFQTCYTEDAKGEFPPLGPLSGHHSIVGSLKEFRRHWPWMQHYGVPLKITLSADGDTAEMWTGRLIPGHIKNQQGEWMYGAHYRIELRNENGLWKFSWSEYVPGWFSEKNPPFSLSK